MRFEVQLTPRAASEVDRIVAWLVSQSSVGANRWQLRWFDVLNKLEERADTFGLAPESDNYQEPIYQVLFKTRRGRRYRGLFLIRGFIVSILHVRGPGQDTLGPDEIDLG